MNGMDFIPDGTLDIERAWSSAGTAATLDVRSAEELFESANYGFPLGESSSDHLNAKLKSRGWDVPCCDSCASGGACESGCATGCSGEASSTSRCVCDCPGMDPFSVSECPSPDCPDQECSCSCEPEKYHGCCCCVEDLIWLRTPKSLDNEPNLRRVISLMAGGAAVSPRGTMFFAAQGSVRYKRSESTGHCTLEWWEWMSVAGSGAPAKQWVNQLGNSKQTDRQRMKYRAGLLGTLTDWLSHSAANEAAVASGDCPEEPQTIDFIDIPTWGGYWWQSAKLGIEIRIKSAGGCECDIEEASLSTVMCWSGSTISRWSYDSGTRKGVARSGPPAKDPECPRLARSEERSPHIWHWGAK